MTGTHTVLILSLRPGVHALSGVLSVLHARKADVDGLDYSVDEGTACLLLRCRLDLDQAGLLVRQLDRRVDVLSAAIRSAA